MNRLIHVLVSLLVFGLFFSARAQNAVGDKPFIQVTGTAESEVVPDEIYIEIVLAERYEGRDKITISAQESEMMAKLRGIGVNLDFLAISTTSEVYRNAKVFKSDVMGKRQYELMVPTAELAGKVLDTLSDMKISRAGVGRLDYSKKEALKKQLLVTAMKNAREKAWYLLDAVGQHAGKPLWIVEGAQGIANTAGNYRRGYGDAVGSDEVGNSADSPWSATTTEFSKLKFSFSITAKYAIE